MLEKRSRREDGFMEIKNKFDNLCRQYKTQTYIEPALYDKYGVKRGLRNSDGSGVMAGLTSVCCVHGYVINEGEKAPTDGELIYRGYRIQDLVKGIEDDKRYGFEEIAYLLLFGSLPNKEHLDDFLDLITHYSTLPPYFEEDVIMRCPSTNIMNKMAQSVLALFTYDKEPENTSLKSEMMKAISIISRLPAIMVSSYQAMRRYIHNSSMVMHPINLDESLAESILSTLRDDRTYTKEEARLLDLCLMLHAEHGGGNNSTFTCRCVTSSGTDAYASYASAISSLKGPRHGGANIKVMEMMEYVKNSVKNWEDEGELADYLRKILAKEAGDRSGLIYGMGHAVYTLSDPRAVILKDNVKKLVKGTELEPEFALIQKIEELTPQLFAESRGDIKDMCANVDMYSGLVYKLLNIPTEMYTALFACARMPGWCAHRMEEIQSGKRIMRPAYKTIIKGKPYVNLYDR